MSPFSSKAYNEGFYVHNAVWSLAINFQTVNGIKGLPLSNVFLRMLDIKQFVTLEIMESVTK